MNFGKTIFFSIAIGLLYSSVSITNSDQNNNPPVKPFKRGSGNFAEVRRRLTVAPADDASQWYGTPYVQPWYEWKGDPERSLRPCAWLAKYGLPGMSEPERQLLEETMCNRRRATQRQEYATMQKHAQEKKNAVAIAELKSRTAIEIKEKEARLLLEPALSSGPLILAFLNWASGR